jgi:ligand-binding sensor domain-containing protein
VGLLAAVGVAAALAAPLEAQSHNIRAYTNADGLPQGQVLAFLQDRDGYLWIGTYGGVGRYNGAMIRSLTTAEGLPSNVIQALGEDAEGRLVVAALGGWVCFVEGPVARERVSCLGPEAGIPTADARDLVRTPDGALWIATDAGLVRIDRDRVERISTGEGLPSPLVRTLEVGGDGTLWAGTGRGLVRIDPADGATASEPLVEGRDVTLVLDTPDGLLVGWAGGLGWIRDGTWTPAAEPPLRSGAPRSARLHHDGALDDRGHAWIGTSDGVLRLEPGGRITLLDESNGLPRREVRKVLVDREGNVWMGTDAGTAKLVPGPFVGYSVAEGLPDPFARAVVEGPAGELIVGTRFGVAVRDPGSDTFRILLPGEAVPDPRILRPCPRSRAGRAPRGDRRRAGARDGWGAPPPHRGGRASRVLGGEPASSAGRGCLGGDTGRDRPLGGWGPRPLPGRAPPL